MEPATVGLGLLWRPAYLQASRVRRVVAALERTDSVINFGEELRAAIDAVDPQLHQFFTVVVNSFIRLEMVVFLRRTPEAEQSAAEIARELGWPEDRVSEELTYLLDSGVVELCGGEGDGVPTYRLSSDPRVADLINKFSFLYANRSSRLLILGHLLREGRRT
ncbi:MAG: hypothetical protein ACM3US_12340 [Sphingomonadaceae bacterium]